MAPDRLTPEQQTRRLVGSQVSSALGDEFAPLALTFAILSIAGGRAWLGLVLGVQAAAMGLSALVGPRLTRRLPPLATLVACDLLRAGSQGLLAVCLVTGFSRTLWTVAILAGLRGLGTAVFWPTMTSYLARTVDEVRLPRVNAVLTLGSSSVGVIGPVAAGVIVAASSPGWAIAVDAVTFVVSASLLLGATRIAALGTDSTLGATYTARLSPLDALRHYRWLSYVLTEFAYSEACTLSVILVVGPLIMQTRTSGARAWSYVLGAMAIGMVVGAAYLVRRPLRQDLQVMLVSAAVPATLALALGLSAPSWVVLLSAGIAGVGLSIAGTLFVSAAQARSRSSDLTTVAALEWASSTTSRSLGFAALGSAAPAIGLHLTLVSVAIGQAAILPLISYGLRSHSGPSPSPCGPDR